VSISYSTEVSVSSWLADWLLADSVAGWQVR